MSKTAIINFLTPRNIIASSIACYSASNVTGSWKIFVIRENVLSISITSQNWFHQADIASNTVHIKIVSTTRHRRLPSTVFHVVSTFLLWLMAKCRFRLLGRHWRRHQSNLLTPILYRWSTEIFRLSVTVEKLFKVTDLAGETSTWG